MFNKFYNFSIDEYMTSEWVKMSGNRGSIFSSFTNDSPVYIR